MCVVIPRPAHSMFYPAHSAEMESILGKWQLPLARHEADREPGSVWLEGKSQHWGSHRRHLARRGSCRLVGAATAVDPFL